MRLYKYVPPERLDVLRNLRIRFTQPGAQNDPFEFQPLIARFRSPEASRQALSPRVSAEFSRQAKERGISLDKLERAHPGCVGVAMESVFTAADVQSDLAAKGDILERLNKLGILSLSDSPNSPLMWCLYAASHAGFVYEFDGTHSWFQARADEKDDTHFLRKVAYVDVPPSPYLAELPVNEVLYSKRKGWEHEREWRIIRPLAESSWHGSKGVYLFDVPPEALTGVIAGFRSTSKSVRQLRETLTNDRRLAHVRIGYGQVRGEETIHIDWQ